MLIAIGFFAGTMSIMIINEVEAQTTSKRTWVLDGGVGKFITDENLPNNPQWGQTLSFTFSGLPELTITGFDELQTGQKNRLNQQLAANGWTEKLCC